MQIAPSVYFYPFSSTKENNCNTIVLAGPERVLLDPGHKHLRPALVAKLAEDGINPRDISLVLHTHCHPDHMEAGDLLEFDHGAVQAMSEVEAEFLAGPGREFFPMMGLDYPRGTIGRLLSPGPLDLGEKVVDLLLTPGHSPGSLCLHWPEAGVLITGDVLFNGSIGRSDFKGGDLDLLETSIDRLAELENVNLILPGHGPVIVGEDLIKANFKRVYRLIDFPFFRRT
jgi:glyoxylase-like metal-dependent hydrolase (beta-lactamase superfamily II)